MVMTLCSGHFVFHALQIRARPLDSKDPIFLALQPVNVDEEFFKFLREFLAEAGDVRANRRPARRRNATTGSSRSHLAIAHGGKLPTEVPTVRGDFQAGQTAKAQPGSPCAVTPARDKTVSHNSAAVKS